MSETDQEEAVREYADFLSNTGNRPPQHVTDKLMSIVHSELFPSPWRVLLRLSSIVFLVGLINLTLCPQFGIGFVRESGLFEMFMSFGHQACKIFCGAFFLGTGLFLSAFILSPQDLRIIRQHRFLQVSVVSSLALIFFVAAGGTVYFAIASYWLVGAMIGGVLCLEAGYMLRLRIA
jgi:hypothetical protein